WGEDPRAISRLMLTASGGPFRDWPLAELSRVTAEEALRHPTWSMGPKITVDSATLLNKGLEVIEARWLFDVPFERIEIVLHRESIVHSLVEFRDGSVKAQLGLPDMRLPIQLALTYPERLSASAPRLELGSVGALHFEAVDRQRFPCLELALEAGRRGGTYPAVLAAADEVAVGLFLTGSIGFLDIPRLLADSLEAHQPIANPSLEEILAADTWARAWLEERLRAGPQARVGWV
ncbi:MAG TPA: 1-deoxy-D-xylulose-5-phosphate reductoisomerase, partial [Dehalococcoidia bacterium]|nr:1-deoxy-D-xylulose-5-phosphate reductoisomerase [Dehalococcoidia bacterium]